MSDDGFRYTVDNTEDNPDSTSPGERHTIGESGPERVGYSKNGAIPTGQLGLAFLTYAFLFFVRFSGLSALFRSPNPRNPLAAPPIREIGLFVFYDAILLTVVGLASSGVLLALAIDDSVSEHTQLTALASLGVGLPAVVLLVGSVFVAII